MNLFLRVLSLILIITLYSCKDKIDNPPDEQFYKVEGVVMHNGVPLESVSITLDTSVCLSDSAGYFLFNSVKSGQSRMKISHPEYNTVDSVINIDGDINLSFDLQYSLYKVAGIITHKGFPVTSAAVNLDTLSCITDSLGYFIFDSLRSGQSEISISHPQYRSIDTLININKNLTILFEMNYRSDSFMPLMIGNKWYYNPNPDHSAYEYVMEVVGKEEVEGLIYYKLLWTLDYGTGQNYWYMRIEDDSLYDIRCDERGLLVPFNAEQDSVFFIHHCSLDYSALLYEKSENELKFNYTAIQALDADFGFDFQKGIGITRTII